MNVVAGPEALAPVPGPAAEMPQTVAFLGRAEGDCALIRRILAREKIEAREVSSLAELAGLVGKELQAVVVTEAALAGPGGEALQEALAAQPAWSDLPFVVLGEPAGEGPSAEALSRLDGLHSAILISRPLRPEVFARALRAALKARQRQHEARARMAELQLRDRQLFESEASFQAIANSVDQMIWSTRPDGFHDYYNSRWYEYTGVPEGSTDGEAWNGMFHPEDQERAWGVWRHSLESGDPYEIEYRLRHRTGQYRWVLGRAHPVRDAGGKILRWYGTCTDIHDMKVAEEQRRLMLAEMNHRVKNTLAMVHSIVSQTLRQAESVAEARDSIQSRITMMSQAHDRLINSAWLDARLREVVETALAPHQDEEPRIALEGPDMAIGARQALALTMALHELATNAAKYGALSAPGGRVEIAWQAPEEGPFSLTWREVGGPEVAAPRRRGFGSRMIEQALAGYFGGEVRLEYPKSGLFFEMSAPPEGLTG